MRLPRSTGLVQRVAMVSILRFSPVKQCRQIDRRHIQRNRRQGSVVRHSFTIETGFDHIAVAICMTIRGMTVGATVLTVRLGDRRHDI